MFFKRRRRKYDIDIKTADKMLQNVFAACDTTPNRVPFDKIVLRSRISLLAENILLIIAIVLFVASFIVPLTFPHSNAFISLSEDSGREITLVDHGMTEDSFWITFGGNPLDFNECYMEGADGHIEQAEKYDRFTNTIEFSYTPMEYNIYIFDVRGKRMHLLLTPHE